MRYVLLWGCLAFGSGPAFPGAPPRTAAPAPRPFAPARLKIEPPGRVDLGETGPLEPKTQAYVFTNTSAAAIALRILDRSPGVTVAGPALERPIPPSASAGLVLRVDPAGWVGPQSRNVRLGTDDPGQGDYYLPVRLRVRPDLTVDGVRRRFGDVGVQESPQAVFTFRRETGQPLALRVMSDLPPYLECEVRPQGACARLACTFSPASTCTWNGGCTTPSSRSLPGWCSRIASRTPWRSGSPPGPGPPSGSCGRTWTGGDSSWVRCRRAKPRSRSCASAAPPPPPPGPCWCSAARGWRRRLRCRWSTYRRARPE
ncbi:MAG: hypothetical protein ABSH53_22430 [Holophaga sp.]